MKQNMSITVFSFEIQKSRLLHFPIIFVSIPSNTERRNIQTIHRDTYRVEQLHSLQ